MKKIYKFLGKNYTFTILRRTILIIIDAFLILLNFFFVLKLLNLNINFNIQNNKAFILISLLTGLLIYISSGQYSSLTQYQSKNFFYNIFIRNCIFILIISFASRLLNINQLSSSFFVIFLIFLVFIIYSLRTIMRDILLSINPGKRKSSLNKNVAIYGAGEAGIQLASTLRLANTYNVKFFVDDNESITNRYIKGIVIKSRNYLEKNISSIDQILIAIPSLNKERQKNIFNYLQKLNIPVLKVPPLSDIYLGTKINQLRPLEIEDILGREPVKNQFQLINKGISQSIICITGAGGSIGSELCLQILRSQPRKIILIDQSEHNLYQINNKLLETSDKNIEIISYLGDCSNKNFIQNVFKNNKIDFIIHAAAYKHVPIVEENQLTGISNNIFSTKEICIAAKKFKVKRVMLISSDKAVRPTNTMGASKRVSELIIKYFDFKGKKEVEQGSKTLFSIVRFGNVLGSSGSVVPLFNKQIANGGPVTITHPEVVRYFMTIKEAAQLVLHATFLCKGGDLFLLDMGLPVKIKDLAEQLIQLKGLTVKNKDNENGDIEIKIIGLRSGEKLYEELLIDGDSIPTSHPYIYKADEKQINFDLFWKKLFEIESAILNNNLDKTLTIIKGLVPEWSRGN